MITPVVRRVLPWCALAGALWFCVDRQRLDSPEDDGWFHLRIGEELLSGWSIRDPGHLGPFDSADWLPTQWASQLAMAGMHRFGGVDAVLWMLGVVQLALVAVVYWGCRRRTSPLPAAATTVLTVLAASYGLSPRPQVVSLLLVAITVFAWLASSRDGRARWWLVALAWLWAPLHGMWPLAPIIGAAALAGIALDRRWSRAQLSRMAGVVVLSVLAPLAGPLGTGVYRAVTDVGGRSAYFDEWGPTDVTRPFAVVLIVMLAIGAGCLGASRRSWTYPFLWALAAGWAVYSTRTTAVAAVIVAPLVAESLQRFVARASPATRGERAVVAGILVAAVVAQGVVTAARPAPVVLPPWVDARLESLPSEAGVLNEWRHGPYLLWRHPDLSFVMHGYGDVFTTDELDRNVTILELRPGWDREVARLDPDAVLVEVDTPLGYALTRDSSWSVVEQDDQFVYLVPAAE